jgi:hypothetical protein
VSVELFRDDDQGYAAWLTANSPGYVLNIRRTVNPSDARMHHADCRTSTGTPPRQDMDRTFHQGLVALTAAAERMGPSTRRVSHRPMRHLPAVTVALTVIRQRTPAHRAA